MKKILTLLSFLLLFPLLALGEPSIAPLLYFYRSAPTGTIAGKPASIQSVPVTIRFSKTPDNQMLDSIERHGVTFKRNSNNQIIHTSHIYIASVNLDSLETLSRFDSILRIENITHPARKSTLDVSADLVQAPMMWDTFYNGQSLDGTGIIIANVDTGIDLYHPAFFKKDRTSYTWIDINANNRFDPGTDAVDLNANGTFDQGERLNYCEATYTDQYKYGFYVNPPSRYNIDIDWLYNDTNENGVRDYGPHAGFDEHSPCFGELVFLAEDYNDNNQLDPGEPLHGLGTSKVLATFDGGGAHYRELNLLDSEPDRSNHGTAAFGILGGQHPGRRFTGMAPGVEFISINRLTTEEEDILTAVMWAIDLGADLVLYEFGSWVMEFLDGSSNLETFISDLYLDGIPQFTAAGNLAGPQRKKHASLTLQPGSTDTLSFSVPESYNITEVYFSLLWTGYASSMPVTKLLIPGEKPFELEADGEEHIISRYSVLSGRDTSPKGTIRLDLLISSDSSFSGDFSLTFSNQRSSQLKLSAFIADNKTAWMHGTQFTNYITDDGTVTTPGTAEQCITVGSFDPRGYRDEKGEISDFSSWGKTIDGRMAVDITAPGFTIIAPSSHVAGTDLPGGYINFGGTSAALPHAAGCAALILQALPEIDAQSLSETLFRSAATDEYTGDVPNDMWGWGKLRIFNAYSTSYEIVQQPEPFFVSQAYPNPFDRTTRFDFSIITDSLHPLNVNIYNILGQHIRTLYPGTFSHGSYSLSWDGTDRSGNRAASGVYFFQFLRGGTKITRSTLLLK